MPVLAAIALIVLFGLEPVVSPAAQALDSTPPATASSRAPRISDFSISASSAISTDGASIKAFGMVENKGVFPAYVTIGVEQVDANGVRLALHQTGLDVVQPTNRQYFEVPVPIARGMAGLRVFIVSVE